MSKKEQDEQDEEVSVMSFKIISMPPAIADEARKTIVSPQYKSLKADVSVATGYGPCRSCLRVFDQGKDHRIYLTYNAFEGRSSLPDPGPIFIHQNECVRFDDDRFPPDIFDLPVYLEAFGDESFLVRRDRMEPEKVDAQIAELFSNPAVKFVNLRNADAGCFIAHVERRN